MIALTLVLLAFAAFEAAIVLPPAIAHPGVTLGMDFTITWTAHGHGWPGTGSTCRSSSPART